MYVERSQSLLLSVPIKENMIHFVLFGGEVRGQTQL